MPESHKLQNINGLLKANFASNELPFSSVSRTIDSIVEKVHRKEAALVYNKF